MRVRECRDARVLDEHVRLTRPCVCVFVCLFVILYVLLILFCLYLWVRLLGFWGWKGREGSWGLLVDDRSSLAYATGPKPTRASGDYTTWYRTYSIVPMKVMTLMDILDFAYVCSGPPSGVATRSSRYLPFGHFRGRTSALLISPASGASLSGLQASLPLSSIVLPLSICEWGFGI